MYVTKIVTTTAALTCACLMLTQLACHRTSVATNELSAIRAPEAYRATIAYSYFPGNNRSVKPNALFSLDVARKGADRSYVFHFGDEQLRYIEGVGRHYLIAPACKQYVDATLEDMNFRIPNSMAPEEIINRLQTTRGYAYVGEESFDNRPAIKYVNHRETTNEDAILVDRETGLPLRSETIAQVYAPTGPQETAEAHGQINIIVEMRDVKTGADDALFKPPPDYAEVAPRDLCADANRIAQSAMGLLWTISVKDPTTR